MSQVFYLEGEKVLRFFVPPKESNLENEACLMLLYWVV